MNWKEVFNWYWEQKGVENPERFLNEENSAELQINTLINQMLQNPEIYNQLLEFADNNEEPELNENQNETDLQEQSQDANPIEEVLQENIENGENV